MIRVLFEVFGLFLLPTALYVAFAMLTRGPGTSVAAIIVRAPVLVLSVLGVLLVTGVLALFGDVTDGKPGQAYQPATVKDGKVVPGQMR